MADVVDEHGTNTSYAFKIRTEEFVNQFRVGFTDECGRAVEWTIQKDTYRIIHVYIHIFRNIARHIYSCDKQEQPVFYSNESTMLLTSIKDISANGYFTVYSAPNIKNECHHAQKYIKTIELEKVRSLLAAGRVPSPEDFLWQAWVDKQDDLEVLHCNSGFCPNHTFKRWKWVELEKDCIHE